MLIFVVFFLFGATRLRKNLASFLPLSLFFLSRARKGGKGEARVSLSLALSLSSSSQFPPLEERERRKKEDEVEKRGNEKKPYLSLDQANALMPSKLLPLSPLLARLSLPPPLSLSKSHGVDRQIRILPLTSTSRSRRPCWTSATELRTLARSELASAAGAGVHDAASSFALASAAACASLAAAVTDEMASIVAESSVSVGASARTARGAATEEARRRGGMPTAARALAQRERETATGGVAGQPTVI